MSHGVAARIKQLELAEQFEQECGGTIDYDEARADIVGANGPIGLHYPEQMRNDYPIKKEETQ